ncbi:MAG: transglutaminase-like cysteine peptidase [Deltaproteobacteria bacterium]|nr:transglutaminase-like cysteine peptidase [Deltaproteobacteria bacterium]
MVHLVKADRRPAPLRPEVPTAVVAQEPRPLLQEPELPRQHGETRSTPTSFFGRLTDHASSSGTLAAGAVLLGAIAGFAPSAQAATSAPSARIDQLLPTLSSAFDASGSFRAEIISRIRAQFGESGVARVRSFESRLSELRAMPESARIRAVNDDLNERVIYTRDDGDHWQSMIETIARGQGDCEDYALAKYTALRMTGVSANKLEVLVGHAITGEMHAVLLVRDGGQNLVLGNMADVVRPLAGSELEAPIYSFNENSAWVWTKPERTSFSVSRMSLAVRAFAEMSPFLTPR